MSRVLYLNKHSCGISKATWPVRKCISTDRAAQQRRMCIIVAVGWVHALTVSRARTRLFLETHPRVKRSLQVITVIVSSMAAFLLSALYDWPMLLNYWSVLLVLAILCVLTTLIVTHLLFDVPVEQAHTQQQKPQSMPSVPASTLANPVSQLGIPLPVIPASQGTPVLAFPETPMPVPPTPLIRVLETIDLSSTNVEHFLDIKAPAHVTGEKKS